ncbi:MAG: DUF899 family protein [Alphaproteobacteria bacterium]|nr:DUF899 family protein [Alphaproteobacteria bacterium]MBV9371852.1 DUF899 family protein [Alphaproteobacteria bacterium]MBV9901299.1 DUF899 family protein [Alphaproteobacteria bacterium]
MADQAPLALVPAAELAARASKPWPNEPPGYRAAREALLAEEIELRRRIARVAAQRRALPPGGLVSDRYLFEDGEGRRVPIAGLFGPHDTLVVYAWMFGPERERPCPMCTNLVGPLAANAADIGQKAALAILGRSPVARQQAFARERGWRNLHFYQPVGDAFARDYRILAPDGSEWAALLVFTRRGEEVRLSWAGEMGLETADPGQDPRGAPDLAPLWNILDLTPAGREADWYPSLDY